MIQNTLRRFYNVNVVKRNLLYEKYLLWNIIIKSKTKKGEHWSKLPLQEHSTSHLWLHFHTDAWWGNAIEYITKKHSVTSGLDFIDRWIDGSANQSINQSFIYQTNVYRAKMLHCLCFLPYFTMPKICTYFLKPIKTKKHTLHCRTYQVNLTSNRREWISNSNKKSKRPAKFDLNSKILTTKPPKLCNFFLNI